jgi:aconitate hydratase
LTDPRTLGKAPEINLPAQFIINDNLIVYPAEPEIAADIEIIYGPNIKPFPTSEALPENICAKAVLKVGDNITTDHIMPAGSKILPYRSNIPYLANHCFKQIKENFAQTCMAEGAGIIIGGANYGQGSSREHAALVPLYLGIKSVITKSFARIHSANLINAGIVPFNFANIEDFDRIDECDELYIPSIRKLLSANEPVVLMNLSKNEKYDLVYQFSQRQRDIIIAGGLLNYTKSGS